MKLEKRNLSSSIETLTVTGGDALWSDWTIAKAVKEGYKASGWVYKAVSLISHNASSVPFVVRNKDNEIEWNHPVTKLLMNPHPYLSRIQFYELLVQWMQLTGDAYLKMADNSRGVEELWPISPDKIAPMESKDNSEFVAGYKTVNGAGALVENKDFTTDNVIHFSLTNPAQPLTGISPLQACAKAVDSDVAQQNWNASAMQNRGVVEGVFTFKKDLDKTKADSIMKRIIDKFSGALNARKPLVIGSEATYTRLSLTALEMDFLNSRNFNRDEIFIVFGVPPQLGGSQEAATYNNFAASMRIFWETTIIPLLNLMATQLNSSFTSRDMLSDGYYVSTDLTSVVALRDNEEEVAKTAKTYYDMGVPFAQINEKFELGFTDYKGWDLPFNGLKQKADNTEENDDEKDDENRGLVLVPTEQRNATQEAAQRDKVAEGPAQDAYADILKRQETAVYEVLEKNEDPISTVKSFTPELISVTTNVYLGVAAQAAETVVVDTRGNKLNFQKRGVTEDVLIQEFLEEEQVILSDVAGIQQTTIDSILEQIRNASDNGYDYNELRKALEDTGIFSPERALRISRTEVGTAASIGQVSSASLAGATHKTWQTSGLNARQQHVNRDDKRVAINDTFNAEGFSTAPRWPSDQRADAGDRINCRCFMTFDNVDD